MIKNKSNYMTSAEAAQILGFSPDHMRTLLRKGKAKGEKLGRNWLISVKELPKIKRKRFPKAKEIASNGSNQ